MNSKQILSIILVLIMSFTVVTPVLACPPIQPVLVIDEIDDVTMMVGETLEQNVTAQIRLSNPKMSTDVFSKFPFIRISGRNMPNGSVLIEDKVGVFKSTSVFTFSPTEPGTYNVIFVARSRLFGTLVDKERVSITVLPEPEPEPEPEPDPEPKLPTGLFGGCFGIGSGGVGPIHPSGMYMHALWNMMNFIEEHTDTTRNELEDMTHLQVLELYYEVLVKVQSNL